MLQPPPKQDPPQGWGSPRWGSRRRGWPVTPPRARCEIQTPSRPAAPRWHRFHAIQCTPRAGPNHGPPSVETTGTPQACFGIARPMRRPRHECGLDSEEPPKWRPRRVLQRPIGRLPAPRPDRHPKRRPCTRCKWRGCDSRSRPPRLRRPVRAPSKTAAGWDAVRDKSKLQIHWRIGLPP